MASGDLDSPEPKDTAGPARPTCGPRIRGDEPLCRGQVLDAPLTHFIPLPPVLTRLVDIPTFFFPPSRRFLKDLLEEQ